MGRGAAIEDTLTLAELRAAMSAMRDVENTLHERDQPDLPRPVPHRAAE